MARSALLALLLVVVAAAVHARAGAHDTLAEGDVVVTENPLIARGLSTDGLSALFERGPFTPYGGDTPLARLTSMTVVQLCGPEARPQHLASVLIHLLNALLLLAVLRRLRVQASTAVFVAFAFALHPMLVESVDWIAQRGRLLALTFALASLGLWTRDREQPSSWHRMRNGASLLAFLLALFAHPFVAALPLVLLALPGPARARLRDVAPHLLLGVAAFGAAWIQAPALELTPLARLLGSPAAVGLLSAHLCAPFGLAYHYPHPSLDSDDALPILVSVVAALVFAGLSVAALRRRDSWVSAGWLWFVSAAFVSVWLPYDVALGGDRDVAFASIGLFLCVAAGVRALAAQRPALRAAVPYVAGLVLIAWAWLSLQRSADWRDSASLNARALAVTPVNAVAQRNLARDLLWRGKLTAAGDELALVRARRPQDPESILLQGNIAFHRARHAAASKRSEREARKLAEAENLYLRAAELAPGRDEPYVRLGEINQRRSDEVSLARAKQQFNEAIQRGPLRVESYERLGQVQLGLFELEPARATLERLVGFSPDSSAAGWCALGLVALQERADDEARRCFERALAIEPDYVEAHTNLGRLMLEAGELGPAEEQLRHATGVHPRFSDALFYLGRTFEAQGRYAEAITQYERTLRQEPRHIRANMGLAWLYAQEGQASAAVTRAKLVLELAGGPARRAEASALLGRVALQSADWAEARLRLQRALELDPTRTEDEVNLGLAQIELGQLRSAQEVFDSLRRRAPELRGVELGLGRLAERRGDWAPAVAHYRAGLEQEPRSWILANALARVLACAPDEHVRDGPEALNLASQCAEVTRRRSFEVLETLAAAQAELGQHAQAIETQRAAIELVPEERRAPMRARLALYEAGAAFRLEAVPNGGDG